MNLAMVLYILGLVCQFEAAFLLLPMACAMLYQEWNIAIIYFCCALLCVTIGFFLRLRKPLVLRIHPREAMVATALCWVVLSLLGCLPFVISGEIPDLVDAFFETVSGFTTTGSSILKDVGLMSYGSRFWRSFTHWVGGMGVLVFLLAIIPSAGGSFMNLMVAESPGPSVGKLVPKVRDTAKALYRLYIALTIIQLMLLILAGMDLFDAATLTMGTAGTGGFSVHSDGFASYTMLQTGIIAVFMMLFGINFNAWYLLAKRMWKPAIKNEEVLTYLGIIGACVVLIVLSVHTLFPDLGQAIHHVFFTVSSVITTTGYATVDFNEWTPFAKGLVVLIMFIGACAGSTGGGIKVSRIIVMVKGIGKELKMLVHPSIVKKVRLDKKAVPHEVVRSINVFLAIYLLVFAASVLLVSLDGRDAETNFTAVAATLNNIGPGLAGVGPMSNFAEYSHFAKLVFCFDMLAGRLELLPMILLFLPSMWLRQSRLTPSRFDSHPAKAGADTAAQ